MLLEAKYSFNAKSAVEGRGARGVMGFIPINSFGFWVKWDNDD